MIRNISKKIITVSIIILFAFSTFSVAYEISATKLSCNPCTSTYSSELEVYFIDVGQGDCILIRTPGYKHVLIDTGKRNYASNVINYLEGLSVGTISAFIATHPHSDHIGGSKEIFDAFDILSVYEPGYVYDSATYSRFINSAEDENCPIYTDNEIDPGYYIDIENSVSFQILNINKNASNPNDASIVLCVEYGSVSFLFTGDINGNIGDYVETYLVDNWNVDVDILKVAHHGSSHASTDYFLNEATPELSVISCGTGNSYGHPHQETLYRLSNHGSVIYRTDENGHVTVKTDGSSWNVFYEKPEDRPLKPIISGPETGFAGNKYYFDFCSNDPNNDQLFYYVDWCDGNNTGWLGPYKSDEKITISHIWNQNGTYIIKAKSKDIYDYESDWNTFNVAMPKNKDIINILKTLQNNYKNIFLILQCLMKL